MAANKLKQPTGQRKLPLLMKLESEGVLRELEPVQGFLGVAYWHYEVVRPGALPVSLKPEYHRLGELRW